MRWNDIWLVGRHSQCDGYAAYRKLAEADRPGGPATLALGCWTHLRREFYKLHVRACPRRRPGPSSGWPTFGPSRARVKGFDPQTASTPAAAYQRRLSTNSIARWGKQATRISGKSGSPGDPIFPFPQESSAAFEDGRVELDNNTVERAIRQSVSRGKNALFAGSEAGGSTRATIASLLATARLNDVDPKRVAHANC